RDQAGLGIAVEWLRSKRATRRSDWLVRQGEVEHEGAPDAGTADEPDLPAQQIGDLAADRQAEPGAAEAPTRVHVRLLKRFKNDRLFVRGNPNASIGYREAHNGPGAIQPFVIAAPAALCPSDFQGHAPLLGEFEGVGEQVLQDLLEPCRIRSNRL